MCTYGLFRYSLSLTRPQGSLIHIIWLEQGPEVTRNFLSQTQLLINAWLVSTPPFDCPTDKN